MVIKGQKVLQLNPCVPVKAVRVRGLMLRAAIQAYYADPNDAAAATEPFVRAN